MIEYIISILIILLASINERTKSFLPYLTIILLVFSFFSNFNPNLFYLNVFILTLLSILFTIRKFSGNHLYYMSLISINLATLIAISNPSNLIYLLISIELTTFSIYLIGLLNKDNLELDALTKYFISNVLATSLIIFSISIINTNLKEIAIVILISSISIKLTAYPFNLFIPEIYNGFNIFTTSILASLAKVSYFAAVSNLFFFVFQEYSNYWTFGFQLISLITLTLPNLIALYQRDVKKVFIFFIISQMGFAFFSFSAIDLFSIKYLKVFLFFESIAIISLFSILSFSENLFKSKFLTISTILILISIIGLPPFGGFFGKLLLFILAIKNNLIVLVIFGIMNSIISLYYTFRIFRMEFSFEKIAIGKEFVIALMISISILLIAPLIINNLLLLS